MKNFFYDYSIEDKPFYTKLQLIFFLFFAGALVGFIYEELYFLIDDHILTWRGSLYGPYLPIYGIGAVVIYLLFHKFYKNPFIVFFGSVLATGVVEYIGGYTVLKYKGYRLWDYTGQFLNIGGHVCLRSVLLFGVLALLSIYVLQPRLFKYFSLMKKKKRNIIFYILLGIIVFDYIMTLIFPNTLGIV